VLSRYKQDGGLPEARKGLQRSYAKVFEINFAQGLYGTRGRRLEKKRWIRTRDTVGKGIEKVDARSQGDLRKYRFGPAPFVHSVYMTYFQHRAQHNGDPITPSALDTDRRLSVCVAVIEILRSGYDCFSQQAGMREGGRGGAQSGKTRLPSRPVSIVHPSAVWWNRPMKKHRHKTGRPLFLDALSRP
jgi:hypothetical protein